MSVLTPSLGTVLRRSVTTRLWIPLLVCLALVCAIATAGVLVFQHYREQLVREKLDDLAAFTELKIGSITRWLEERLNDADSVSRDRLLAYQVRTWLRQGAPDDALAERITDALEALRTDPHYYGVALLDEQAQVKLSVGRTHTLHAPDIAFARRVIKDNTRGVSQLHWPTGKAAAPEMHIAAPLSVADDKGSQTVGAVLFHLDLGRFLFPYVRFGPIAGHSAEALLAYREADEVVFLTVPRDTDAGPAPLRLPMDTPSLVAAMALHGESSPVKGVDYQGKPVYGAFGKVPGTDWVLVSKLDRQEVLAPVQRLAGTVGGLAGLLMVLTTIIAGMWWRARATGEVRAERARLEHLMEVSPAVIYTGDTSGSHSTTFVSPNVTALTGYEPSVFVGHAGAWAEHVHPDDRARTLREIEAVFERGLVTVEYRFRHADGAYRWMREIVRPLQTNQDDTGTIVGAWFNITEVKQQEEALQRLYERFHAIFNSSRDGIVFSAADGTLIECNDAFVKLTGYPREELMAGIQSRDITPPEYHALQSAVLQRLYASGEPQEYEKEYLRKDGSRIPIQVTLFTVKDSGGTMIGRASIIQDVSERKRIEEELHLFRKLIDQSLDGIEILDPTTGRFLDVNENLCRNLGYARKELLSLTVFDIDTALDQRAFEQGVEAARESGGQTWEGTHRRKDGSIFPVEVNFNYVPLERDYIIAVVRDVTERRRTEQALRERERELKTLMSNLPGMVYRCRNDRKWTMRFVSDGCVELTGYTPEDLVGNHRVAYGDLIHPEDRDEVWNAVQPALEKRTSFQIEYRIRTRQAEEKWLWEQGAGNFRNGELEAIEGFIMDVTTHKHTEARLAQAEKIDAVGQLTSGIAHDFNNLLTVILGNLQLLERFLTDNPNAQKRIKTAIDASQRGATLISRLLAFSRKQTLKPVVLDAAALITGMADLLRHTLGEIVSLKLAPDDDLWPIAADPGQLETALLNLAINARDAMPDGGALTIEAENRHLGADEAAQRPGMSPGDYVVLAVSDEGCGIPADELGKVFDPFFTTKGVGRGSGLGLAMVYGFVKQSGGYVNIYSELGQGTTVKLYFPRSGAAGTAQTDVAGIEAATPTGNERILVVEDDAGVRDTAISMLETLGYRVVSAVDGPSARATLDAHDDIDVLFTDMVMPGGMNGLELAGEARRRHPRLGVVLATGYAEEALFRKHDGARRMVMLFKPYSHDQLARAIRDALRHSGGNG